MQFAMCPGNAGDNTNLYNLHLDGMLACGMQTEASGGSRQKGQVQGYCLAKAFYGTVQPLHAEAPEGKVGLCGQGLY
jgi:hypothetical protein